MWSAFACYPNSIEVHGARLDGRLVGVGLRFPPGGWPGTRGVRIWTLGLIGSLPMLVAFPRAIRLFRHMSDIQGRHPAAPPTGSSGRWASTHSSAAGASRRRSRGT